MTSHAFHYEHIGHMQFSVLTLEALSVIDDMSCGGVETFVPWHDAQDRICSAGFTTRQANGELERFCYGFECIERGAKGGVREIAFTDLGRMFIDQLTREAPFQSSQVACLIRPARRRNSVNVTVQESTFFTPALYELISQYRFRRGPARDFLKCMTVDDCRAFLLQSTDVVASCPSTPDSAPHTLQGCIDQVAMHGKYWASVGGKYSWYVFPQRFSMVMDDRRWRLYEDLMNALVRPPEWGGGHAVSHNSLLSLLGCDEVISDFRDKGVIRSLYDSATGRVTFCLTAPGYLMWERKTKGFILEIRLRQVADRQYLLSVCDASDWPAELHMEDIGATKTSEIPKWDICCGKDELASVVEQLICHQNTQTNLWLGSSTNATT
jgi:hypothetical protein